jgi:hypothetical protein
MKMQCRAVLIACAIVATAMIASGAAAPATPIVVELFTSEGCSSCPPADALLQSLADSQPIAGAQILALGEHVDYWDELGWRDRFSSHASTNRQQGYARVFNIDSIYTPEMVVDGRDELVGSDRRGAQRAIERAIAAPHASVELSVQPSTRDHLAVTVVVDQVPKRSRSDRADVIVAISESGLRTNVRGGENRGRTLVHAAVMRQMTTIGEIAGDRGEIKSDVPLASGWDRGHVTIVAFVQERFSRHILGAAARALP